MCGIAGSATVGAPHGGDIVKEITASQRDRGPDGSGHGEWRSGDLGVVLGHARLSIIDLSDAAAHPMTDRGGRFRIVFNGEIYNYLELRAELIALGAEFRTASDTEVILEAWRRWGPETPQRLFGMFAFALLDGETGELWLVRDRFGVKPLYYHERNGVLWFASTPKVMARRLGLRPDLNYVARGLAYWIYEDDLGSAPYEGIRALPGGHLVRVTGSGGSLQVQERRWYDLEARVRERQEVVAGRSLAANAEETMMLLADAVSIRFRADVPVALSLSGGLDSTAIASMAQGQGGTLHGFTYGHPDERESEGPLVAQIAARFRLQPHYIRTHGDAALGGAFRATVEAQDAPFPGTSIIAQHAVFARAHQEGLKVLLGGQGGDEAYMGYQKYQLFYLRRLVQDGHPLRALGYFLGLLPSIAAAPPSFSLLTRQWRRFTSKRGLPTLPGLPTVEPLEIGAGSGPLWRRQILDVTRLSIPTLLRYEDRNSMAHSVESRLPFMDHRLIEQGLALSDDQKLSQGRGKRVLREGLRGRIPEEVRLSRLKLGFEADQRGAVAAGLGGAIRGALAEVRPAVAEFLGREVEIEERFSDHRLVREPAVMAEAVTLYWLGLRG
jgi:asparagine synthase (glutamine-hydrolysing)